MRSALPRGGVRDCYRSDLGSLAKQVLNAAQGPAGGGRALRLSGSPRARTLSGPAGRVEGGVPRQQDNLHGPLVRPQQSDQRLGATGSIDTVDIDPPGGLDKRQHALHDDQRASEKGCGLRKLKNHGRRPAKIHPRLHNPAELFPTGPRQILNNSREPELGTVIYAPSGNPLYSVTPHPCVADLFKRNALTDR